MSLVLEVLVSLLWTLYYMVERTIRLVVPVKFLSKDVKGQIVLITGGGSGIGRLLCLRFGQLGATVVTWDINKTGNLETVEMVKKEGGRAYDYTVDMTNKDEIYSAAEKTAEDIGPVSILINNAGIVSGTSLLDTPDSKVIRTFQVNTLAHFWTIKAFLPSMINNKQGHICSIASLAGTTGSNKLVDYCSSKFAAVGMDESLRVELDVQGHLKYINTTIVCPYYISTGMFDGVQSKVVPILTPEFVADSTVTGILTNKEIVLLPWWTVFLVVFKVILPSPAFLKLGQAIGITCSMDQFVGRTKKD